MGEADHGGEVEGGADSSRGGVRGMDEGREARRDSGERQRQSEKYSCQPNRYAR